MVPLLSHGVVVEVVEEPFEGSGSVVTPFRIVYGRKKKVLHVHELTKRELVVELHIFGHRGRTS